MFKKYFIKFLHKNRINFKKVEGKISSFAKYVVGFVLAFCKCADVGRKKAAGKRINFGWETRILCSLFSVQFYFEKF